MTDIPAIVPYCGGLLATNGYLVEGPEGRVLIDAPEGAVGWLKSIDLRPDYLLLTHMHFDHILGASSIIEEFGCHCGAFASAATPDLTLEEAFNGFEGTSFSIRQFSVDTVLEGLLEIDAGGLVFELLHVPGHSPDSLCFYLRDKRLLFGGDVLMAGGVGRTDFPHGDPQLLAEGIANKVVPLGEDVQVFPGHGRTTHIGSEIESLKMIFSL